SKLNGPSRIAQALRGLEAADFIEEPAAARVHEQRVPLHFQEPKSLADQQVVEIRVRMPLEKLAHRLGVSVQDDLDVAVAGLPGIRKALRAARRENVVQMVLELVERLPQRPTPLLMPAASHVAATVGAPAFHAMLAAPRAVLVNLHLPLGRVQFQVLA